MGQPSFTAAELAERFGLELQGDGAVRVHGVGTLARAQAGSWLSSPIASTAASSPDRWRA